MDVFVHECAFVRPRQRAAEERSHFQESCSNASGVRTVLTVERQLERKGDERSEIVG